MAKNKVLIALLILLIWISAKAQNAIVIKHDEQTSIFVMVPVSQLIQSEESSQVEYQVSLNLLDAKNKTVYQSIESLKFKPDELPWGASPYFEIRGNFTSGKYKLVMQLRNQLLGDKQETIYNLSIGAEKSEKTVNLIVMKMSGIDLMPGGYEELNVNPEASYLIWTSQEEADSTVLKAVVNEKTVSVTLKKETDSRYDLMPLLKSGTVSWLEMQYYQGNILESRDWLFYRPADSYQSRYSSKEQLLQIKYIASQNEWRTIKKLADKDEEGAISYFWKKHSNSPEGGINDFKEVFTARVLKADELFTIHKKLPGWKSDRGRIFIIKGPPDDINEDVFPIGKRPYIIWRYFEDNSVYTFVDRSGYGNYTLEAEESDF